ncbi:MAG: hypothetical protein ABFD14_11945 [Anaerolineaceae bacterium]
MKSILKYATLALLIFACACTPQKQNGSISTTETAQMEPTSTPTVDEAAINLAQLPESPAGFEWKYVPEIKTALLMPDDWYFKQEPGNESYPGVAVYITPQNMDATGGFTTGQAIFMLANADDLQSLSTDILEGFAKAETTTKILDAWDYTYGDHVQHNLMIQSSISSEDGSNKEMTIQYSTIIENNAVYLTIFQSLTSDWEKDVKIYKTMMDQMAIFSVTGK